jgi:hypothetical protein
MSGIATAVVGGAIIGGIASNKAANTQADAANNAANIQYGMWQQEYANQQPWVQSGQAANSELNYLLGLGSPNTQTTLPGGGAGGSATGTFGTGFKGGGAVPQRPGGPTLGVGGAGHMPAPNDPRAAGNATDHPGGGFGSLLSPFTIDTFKQFSPAYKFQQQQGMQGVLNGDASGAGALSGAAQKDLMGFNQELAGTAFNNAFNQYQTQQGNIYARLAGISQTGQTAASNAATGASSFGGNVGSQVANAGTARAGGIVGAANSLGSIGALPWLTGGGTPPAGGFGDPNATAATGMNVGDFTGGNADWLTSSDRRLKGDIERIGEWPSGLPTYRFRYLSDPSTWHVGVMADEAEVLFPDAVTVGADGYKMVDYSRIS